MLKGESNRDKTLNELKLNKTLKSIKRKYMAEEKDETIITDDEEVIEEDKTSEEDKKPEANEEEKPKRSDIAQKIKYREKYQEASTRVSKLETELAELKGMVKKPADDAEARAQEYIRSQAKAVYEELLNARKSEEEKVTRQFEDKVEAVLEENPDISEEELLDAIEEYEVEPNIALKILKKTTTKKEKPKMPQAKRASAEGEPEKDKPDDSKKTMWQILQEESKKLKK